MGKISKNKVIKADFNKLNPSLLAGEILEFKLLTELKVNPILLNVKKVCLLVLKNKMNFGKSYENIHMLFQEWINYHLKLWDEKYFELGFLQIILLKAAHLGLD